jgi:hypothetical protein
MWEEIDKGSLTPEQQYWADPGNEELFPEVALGWRKACVPDFYINLHAASEFYVKKLIQHAPFTWSILELGANCGRNLDYFKKAGWKNVAGIELNEDAIRNAHTYYPDVAHTIRMGLIQELLPDWEPVDIIFTSVVLMHIPWHDDWVLDAIASKAQKLIMTTEIENSSHPPGLKFQRNYREEFEKRGFKQLEWMERTRVHKIGGCTMRILARADQ